MPKFNMIVLTNAIAGREAEFNDWYDNVHLGDVLAVPGVTAAQRFEAVMEGEWKYAAIYELDCEDPRAVMNEITSRWKTDRMPASDAFDDSNSVMLMVRPTTELRG